MGTGDGQFQPGSVRIVDYDSTNKNILVRGSAAFGQSNFTNMSLLYQAIQNDVNFSNLPLTIQQNIQGGVGQVVDFCVMGYATQSSKDYQFVLAEATYWNFSYSSLTLPDSCIQTSSPYYYYGNSCNDQGVMVLWPVLAVGAPYPYRAGESWAVSPTPSLAAAQANFLGLVPAIRGALTNTLDTLPEGANGVPFPFSAIQNSLIYVHCDSGVNRTGAAVVAYLATYGSNLAPLSGYTPVNSTATPYPMMQAQSAANAVPPSDDSTPPGGADIPVAEAYVNYQITGSVDAVLSWQAVPLFDPNS